MAADLGENARLDEYPGTAFEEQEKQKDRIFPQFLAGIIGNLTAVVSGCIIGWTSPSIPILEGPNSPIPITTTQNSWISSIMPLAGALGPFAGGYFAEKLGRKRALLCTAIPAVTSWLTLGFATSVAALYVGRFIAGITIGWIFTVLPMYCSEIANKSVRGAMGSLMQIFIVFGLLFDYCIGPYVPFAWLSLGAAVIPVIFLIFFIWMPESPYFLLMKEEKGKAEKSLKWLRGKSGDGIFHELLEIQENVEKAKSETGSLKDLFATWGTTKALIISLGLVGFQQLSGINVVLFNAQSIFEKAGTTFKPEISAIITASIMLVSASLTPFIVDRLGRKFLLLVSAGGMAVAQGVLGLCFFLDKNGTDTTSFNFLPIIAVVFYIFVYCIGFGPLPWAVMSEMFPGNIKSLASTLTASFCWVLGFFVTRFFNDIVVNFGSDYSFWLFSGCCLLALVFTQFVLFETKGKTFNEIQDILNKS